MDFRSVATKMKDDVKRPPLPPTGTYLFQVSKFPTIETSKDEKWDFVTYQVRGVSAVADVDTEALHAFGGPTKVFLRKSFVFNKEDEAEFQRAEYQHKRFLDEHLKCWPEGASLKEAMDAAVNRQFLGDVSWKPDRNDPETFNADIGKTAAAK